MAWLSEERAAAQKLIRDSVLQTLCHINIGFVNTYEVDAIICVTFGSGHNEEQLVVKVHELVKRDPTTAPGGRCNGEGSLLREYLAGNASAVTPQQQRQRTDPSRSAQRKRKTCDENDNAILYATPTMSEVGRRSGSGATATDRNNKTRFVTVKSELDDATTAPNDACDITSIPLNLSDRKSDDATSSSRRHDKEPRTMTQVPFREVVADWRICGRCSMACDSYTALQDHFVDAHGSSLRFYCSECSTGFSDELAHQQHSALHVGGGGQSAASAASNRRKQRKPRRGVAGGSDVSDDDGGAHAFQRKLAGSTMALARYDRDRSFERIVMDRSEGIVRSLLQKQSPATTSVLSEIDVRLKLQRGSPRSSPLALAAPDDAVVAPGEYRCPHCAVGSADYHLFAEHCKAAHKRFACRFCLQTFTQRVNRDRHLYNHTGEKPFECPECGSGFTRRDALKKHQQRANHMPKVGGGGGGGEAPSSVIEIAPPSYSLSPSINDYHEPKREISEDSADGDNNGLGYVDAEAADLSVGGRVRTAASPDDRNSSLTTYHDDVPVPTGNDPGPSFAVVVPIPGADDNLSEADEASLNSFGAGGGSHSFSIASSPLDFDKSFKCDYCQEMVTGIGAYREHCKSQHRRTPCVYCGKTFSQKGNMERHVRQHTGQRPFQCQFCKCSYTRKETLKVHVNQAHANQLLIDPETDNCQ